MVGAQGERRDERTARPWNASLIVAVIGRVLIAALFVFAGVSKILGPQPYLDHMTEFGVPTQLLPAVIGLEIGAALALLSGWRLRDAAAALGIFCVLTAVIFHHQLDEKTERTHFFKDLAISGGLLAMAASANGVRRARGGSPGALEPIGGRSLGRTTDINATSKTISRTTTTVVADGVPLAVHRIGGTTPIVCLHAVAHDAHDFDAFAARVSDRFELVCLEWPGHGESGDDPQPPSAVRYADLLVAALDQLGLDRPILIGNSIGGAAAISYASRRPVRGLVLCDSGGLVEITPTVIRVTRIFQRFFAAGERGARWFGPVMCAYYHTVLTQPAALAQRERIVAGARRRATLLREAWESFGRPSADLRAVAAGLAVPIWVAWAEKDRTVPLSFCLPAIKRLKRATLTTFSGGHTPFLEQPDAFTAGFRDFVASLSP
jgi:pimeloyl-ACP methyl ester carboxylesterase/uncharacterized membrane protein YphA (DoxX/SURF4 family)